MKNFQKTLLSSVISAGVIASASYSSMVSADSNSIEKPNVILIFLDDAGYADVSKNGGKYPTPNIDKMADEGVNFTSYYTSSPVSSPSRAGLLTGRLGQRTGMWGDKVPVFFEWSKNGLPKQEVTIAEMLKSNGYSTVMYGKWHLGIGKDGTEHIPTRHGFDEWYGIPTSNDMFLVKPEWRNEHIFDLAFKGKMKEVMPLLMAREEVIAGEDGYGIQDAFDIPVYHSYKLQSGYKDDVVGKMQQVPFTKDVTDRAIKYIDQHEKEPFFMFMSYPQNHVPLFASEDYKGKTDSAYGDVMLEIDASIGRIMDELKSKGLDDNTMVIFTSDNGPSLSHARVGAAGSALPFKDGKQTTWEGGVRVPGVIHWSGKVKPADSDAIISTLDMLPTIASATNSNLPDVALDGVDMMPLLLGKDAEPRKVMPYYYMGNLQAFRSGDWKIHLMTSNAMGMKKNLDKPELYNLKDDLSEKNNLADTHPEIVKRLMKEAQAYNDSLGKKAEPLFDI